MTCCFPQGEQTRVLVVLMNALFQKDSPVLANRNVCMDETHKDHPKLNWNFHDQAAALRVVCFGKSTLDIDPQQLLRVCQFIVFFKATDQAKSKLALITNRTWQSTNLTLQDRFEVWRAARVLSLELPRGTKPIKNVRINWDFPGTSAADAHEFLEMYCGRTEASKVLVRTDKLIVSNQLFQSNMFQMMGPAFQMFGAGGEEFVICGEAVARAMTDTHVSGTPVQIFMTNPKDSTMLNTLHALAGFGFQLNNTRDKVRVRRHARDQTMDPPPQTSS